MRVCLGWERGENEGRCATHGADDGTGRRELRAGRDTLSQAARFRAHQARRRGRRRVSLSLCSRLCSNPVEHQATGGTIRGERASGEVWGLAIRRVPSIVLGFGLAFVFVLGACGDDESGSTPTTGTTVSPAATSEGSLTATATATYAPPPTPSTAGLPGDIAAAIDAVRAHDAARLELLITVDDGPPGCRTRPRDFPPSRPRVRPVLPRARWSRRWSSPGARMTTRPATSTPRSRTASPRSTQAHSPDLFIGVVGVDGPVRFAALWGAEKILWLGFDADGKLIGAGGGGECPAYELLLSPGERDLARGPGMGRLRPGALSTAGPYGCRQRG